MQNSIVFNVIYSESKTDKYRTSILTYLDKVHTHFPQKLTFPSSPRHLALCILTLLVFDWNSCIRVLGLAWLVLSCLVLSCLVLSCCVLTCIVMSWLVLSLLILSCPVLFAQVLLCCSCLVWSCLVLSGRVLSGLVLPLLVCDTTFSQFLWTRNRACGCFASTLRRGSSYKELWIAR